MFDTIAGGKTVVVDQLVLQRDVVGGGRAVKVPTMKGRVDADAQTGTSKDRHVADSGDQRVEIDILSPE